jgi:hypothetical protein
VSKRWGKNISRSAEKKTLLLKDDLDIILIIFQNFKVDVIMEILRRKLNLKKGQPCRDFSAKHCILHDQGFLGLQNN